MYALLQAYSPYFDLHEEDVQRIQVIILLKSQYFFNNLASLPFFFQKLYGPRKVAPSTAKPEIPKIPEIDSKRGELCNGNFDSIIQFEANEFFILKGESCWLFKDGRLKNGYPKLIMEEWPYNFHYFQRNNTYWNIILGNSKSPEKISSFIMDGHLHIFKGKYKFLFSHFFQKF